MTTLLVSVQIILERILRYIIHKFFYKVLLLVGFNFENYIHI